MVSPARLTAFEILLRVETQRAYASELLHSDRLTGLTSADRGLCMELVMGVLRWRSRLDEVIAHFSFTPFRKLDIEVVTALRMGAYQIQFLERIPARAAIHESVELVKGARKHSAAPLVNAVLRKIPKTSIAQRASRRYGESQEPGPAEAPSAHSLQPGSIQGSEITAERLARGLAHPQWLVERWIAHFGTHTAAAICRFDQGPPAAALRLGSSTVHDPSNGQWRSLEEELRQAGVELAPGQLLKAARRLVSGDPIHTPTYAQGRVGIQDEASQLIAALVGTGERILDCCAAPGGKTAAIAQRNPRAEILALDIHERRARMMRSRLGAANARIVVADARNLPVSGDFDRILADVPCSGTGTLARNPEIKWRLGPGDFGELRALQLAIMRAALAHLAPGGRLIYSTCSLEPEENHSIIEEVLGDGASCGAPAGGFRIVDCRTELERLQAAGELSWPDPDGLVQGPFLRTLPGVHPCDGFFAAIVERVERVVSL